LDFDASGNLVFTDSDAAVGAPVGMSGVEWGGANAGVLSAFQLLRAENPNLRIGVSVGGWSKSGDFSVVCASDSLRGTLVTNILKFVKYENLDFVDIDWEYPNTPRDPDLCDNSRDEGTPKANPADRANYIKLLQDLRKGLDAQGKELGKTYELTVALPAAPNKLDAGIDIEGLFEIVDFANVMTYDLYGGWSNFSAHHTGLYNNPSSPEGDEQFSVENALKYLSKYNIDKKKIIIGCAFYSRGWSKVSNNGDPKNPGLYGTAEAVGKDADGTATYGGPNEGFIFFFIFF
jgi:chitinase